MTIDTDVRRRSVTRDDYSDNPYWASLYYAYPANVGLYGATYAPLPPWWSVQRDFALRRSLIMESLWAGAVSKAITRVAALGWELEDEGPQRKARFQALYLGAVAGMSSGWVPFISAHLRDYLLTDNGAFFEIVRATSGAASRILGIAHLDSARCTRTADPDVPVIYRDRQGALHEMKAHQVVALSDLPDPSETWNGVGYCAASRAYLTIAKFAAMQQYLYEKMAGDGATELAIIQGMSQGSLESMVRTADNAQVAKGSVYYKGKILSAVLGDQPLSTINIPLKNVPDGFDYAQELTFAQRIYALALGLPEQAIAPLSGQGLGTGTQTVLLEEQSEGEGLAAWLQQWKHIQNERILPESTTFTWNNVHDIRDRKAKADLAVAQTTAIRAMVGNEAPVWSPQQALQWSVDQDLSPREFIPQDATTGGGLADDEKPADGALPDMTAMQQALYQLQQPPPPPPAAPATKAQSSAAKLVAAELDEATKLARAVLRD